MNTTILKFILSLICFSFVLISNAQEPYFCAHKGTKLEYIKKCPDGKIEGYTQVEIIDVKKNIEDKDTVGAIIYTSNILNRKMKSQTKGPIKMRATYSNGDLTVDMGENITSMFTAMFEAALEEEGEEIDEEELEEVNEKLRIEIVGEPTIFPSDVKPGDKLVDVFCSVKVMWMTKRVSSTERNVLREEDITTDAGTYRCMVVEEKMLEKGMGSNKETTVITWYSRGVGSVRIETYNKRGKLETIEELASLVMMGI